MRRFFAWCEQRGLTLAAIRPFDVAAWVNELQQNHGAPGVKQQLAAVRMLFDWLITGQVVPFNPASAVRGPKHVVKSGNRLNCLARDAREAPLVPYSAIATESALCKPMSAALFIAPPPPPPLTRSQSPG
jgi:hypothetical protein